jgi:DNA-binding NarL/FixJ family response regulator
VGVRVFLVEDMKPVRDVLMQLLASVGEFRVVGCAGTEAEARYWLAEHPGAWDLAVIDLVLDQGSGMGAIPVAYESAARQGGRIVVFSDYASDGIRNHCLRLGADAVFLKSQTRDFMDYCSELGGIATACAP